MLAALCDGVLAAYGALPVPHRGRDRLVAFLERRARARWTGVRTITRRGLRLWCDFSVDDVGWTLYSYGCLDYFDEQAMRRLLPPGGIAIDAGANIGYYSLLLARWTGSAGRVVSFEPVPFTYSFLQRNLGRNGGINVTPVNCALGSGAGRVRMTNPSGARIGHFSVAESGGFEVPCATLDGEIARLGLGRVDFIKIDVQGYELEVLRGAEDCLHRFRPSLMFEVDKKALHEHGVLPCQLERFVRERGYELFRANRRGRLAPAQCVSDDSVSWFNLFAVHSCSI